MYHGQVEIEHSQVRLQVPPWPLETIISMWEPQLLICQGHAFKYHVSALQ